MINSITRYNIYSVLFKNPLAPTERAPEFNALYGAGVTALYARKFDALARKDVSTYLQSFNNTMTDLKNVSSKLISNTNDSVFNTRSAQSSDKNIVTATAAPNAEKKEYTIKVDNLALSQVNQSVSIDSRTTGGFSTGFHAFKIESGTKSASIYLDVKSYQTNKEVLQDASAKINASGLGLTSTVEEKDGQSFLKLTSATGTSNAFTLTDTTGSFVSRTQLGIVAQTAKDAKYSVDDKQYTSASNEIKLDNNKVSVTLKGVDQSKVMVGDDTETVMATVKGFAENFNKTLDFLNTHRGNVNVTRLENDLLNSVKFRKYDMEEIGIEVDSDGSLSVDEAKLQSAMKTDMQKVKSTLGSYSGLAVKVNHEASEALARPMLSYADYPAYNQSISSYSNMYNYMNTAQRQYLAKTLQQGALFDMVL